MLDLSKVNLSKISEEGFEFELTFPKTGEGLKAFVIVRGENSPVVKAYGRRKYSEFKMREQVAKRKGKEVDDLSLDELEDMAVEGAVLRTIGWRGVAENGKEIPFTKEEAARIYKEHPWIREQVMEESQNILNFRPEGD